MVDPSCLYEEVQEKILCLFRTGVNRNLKGETPSVVYFQTVVL